MKKTVQFDKLPLKTKDLTAENIAKISTLFPNLITETEKDEKVIKTINADKLKELVGDYAKTDSEVYELTWVGKQESKQKIVAPITKTLRPVPKESVDFENTENLYIEGDNFEVLKVLQESYLNKVKMIYIDPPYNTGKDFVYKDNFSQSKDEYDEESGAVDEEGNKLFKNTTTNGRFHSDWLSMMYERLVVAKDLLRDDGVIFISIDDNEVANLRKICDEVFGEGNFIKILPTIMNLKGNNDEYAFAGTHEFTLVYTKSPKEAIFNELIIRNMEKVDAEWDKDEHGYFKIASLKSSGENGSREKRPNLFFPIYVNKNKDWSLEPKKDFEKVLPISNNVEMTWRWSKEKLLNEKHNIVIEYKSGTYTINRKIRTIDETPTIKPKSLFYKPEYSSGNGIKIIKELFDGKRIFEYSKPILLIKDFVEIGTTKEDIILDFFSGSGTTAHAIIQLNSEDGGNRKFIVVQLPEKTAEDSEAFKSGYKNICEIGKERIRRAAKKIQEELKEKNKQTKLAEEKVDLSKLDFGFRVFRLDSSNMKDVYYNPEEINQTTLTNFKDNIKEDRTDKDLLYQVLLDLAVPISAKVEEQEIKKKTIYKVNENFLIACFDEDIDLDIVKEIAKLNPLRLVFKDSSFKDDSAKVNVDEYLKHKLSGCIVRVI